MAEGSLPDNVETCLGRAIEALILAALSLGDAARLSQDRPTRDFYTAEALRLLAAVRDLKAGRRAAA